MIEALNRDCFCVSLDCNALRRARETDPAAASRSCNIRTLSSCRRPCNGTHTQSSRNHETDGASIA